jgi:hypothetical protein
MILDMENKEKLAVIEKISTETSGKAERNIYIPEL